MLKIMESFFDEPPLTPEERDKLAVEDPNLLALIDRVGDDKKFSAKWALHAWRHPKTPDVVAAEIQQDVRAAMPKVEQTTLAHWCGYPTDMTRCSPFFPLRHNDLSQRKFLRNFLITAAGWGQIEYTGPQLTTYEEDCLLAVLALVDKPSASRAENYVVTTEDLEGEHTDVLPPQTMHDYSAYLGDGEKTYTYTGPILPLLRLISNTKSPSKKDYQRLISSLELLTVAAVKLSISDGTTKNGKRRPPRKTSMTNLLSHVEWNEKEKILSVTVNPFFYACYMNGRTTLLDVVKRKNLKGSVAKALYRFVQSQRSNIVFNNGHFLTLADALNMDREQPAFTIRKLLKSAISELIRAGILEKKSGFVGQDLLKLTRTENALPKGKK